jgi:transposase
MCGSQKCTLVQERVQSLGIELVYLPAYSPHLNLIARFWKWVKKSCLYSKYYATSDDFQKAIQECIAQAHSKHQAELEGLLTWRFQTFREVPVIGEAGQVSPFPGARQSQKKVSSKAV